MVKIENVSVKYKKTVLKDVNITAEKGQCIGLLGLNGSGKSTLLSAISGIKKPAAGKIYIEGKTGFVTQEEDENKVWVEVEYSKGKTGFVTQENALIDELTAYDNILMWTSLKKDQIMKALADPELSILKVSDFINVKVRNMSGGMKKRLALASVIITGPDILLMDEPLAALDIPAKSDIIKFIDAYKAKGGIIFIASHEAEVFDHCDKVYHFKDGNCVLTDKSRPVTEIING